MLTKSSVVMFDHGFNNLMHSSSIDLNKLVRAGKLRKKAVTQLRRVTIKSIFNIMESDKPKDLKRKLLLKTLEDNYI